MTPELRRLKRCRDYVIMDVVLEKHIMCPIHGVKCKATCAFYSEYVKEYTMDQRKRKRIVRCNLAKADIGEI